MYRLEIEYSLDLQAFGSFLCLDMVRHVDLSVRYHNTDQPSHRFAETFEQSSQGWNRNDSTNNPGDRRISVLKGYHDSWK